MMGEEHLNNKGCVRDRRTFEEDIYWTNFKSVRFFQLLSGDFLDHLVIPEKFSENLKDRLPQTLVLEGPGGASSEVRLVKDYQGTLLLKDGWKEFATAHKFLESDLLMFKYKRDSYLKVTVFDRRSFCENASSYFVRQCNSPKEPTAENSRPKRNFRDTSVDAAATELDSEFQSSDSDWANSAGSSRRKGHRRSNFVSRKRDAEVRYLNTPNVATRRIPSMEEKKRALQSANKELTKDSFLVVMKSSHVSKRGRICIPAGWARKHLTCKHQDMVLQVKEKNWIARLTFCNNSGSGLLGTGWSVFAKDNSLQEGDVCVLELSSRVDELSILDVRIFYAGEGVANQPSPKLSPM